MLDRRLGTAALVQQTEVHVAQMQVVLERSVGGKRADLAAALAAAAGLAGWQALDQGSIQRAWQMHDLARTAAHESGNATVLAHVTAQSAYVLLDANQGHLALQLIQSATEELGSKSPRLLSVWLAAAEAEAAAAVGGSHHARRQLDLAQKMLDGADGAAELPYLMLNEAHLARWRGHCLARLGEFEAIEYLNVALERVGDSVRAATGLHVDLAHAYRQAGQLVDARQQVRTAIEMARRFGSRRQQNRLRALMPAAESQVVEQTDQGAGVSDVALGDQGRDFA
jgi:tetratricopeptide (TPR) repeat protein